MSGKAVLLHLEQVVGGLTIPETSQPSLTMILFKVRRSHLFPRIVWVGSNLKYHILPATHHSQVCLVLHQAAQTPFESTLKHFQWWGIHNISGQRGCLFSPFEKKAVICPASETSELLQSVVSPSLHRPTTESRCFSLRAVTRCITGSTNGNRRCWPLWDKIGKALGVVPWTLYCKMWKCIVYSFTSCTERQSWKGDCRKMGINKARKEKREKSVLHFLVGRKHFCFSFRMSWCIC